jgi:hypothetical protein
MSDFFDLPVPPPEPEKHRQPAWLGPPENELGVAVPMRIVLARSADVALGVVSVTAFSTGFSFGLAIRRRVEPDEHGDPFMRHGRGASDDALRLGVQFSDGAKATTLGHPHWPRDPNELPLGPILIPHGGSGGMRTWDMHMWVWPLPPPGALAFVCQWPAEAIELTRVEVAAQPVLDAASAVEPLWAGDDDVARGGGWVGYGSAG